jgi:hypothetical protein
VSNKSGYQSKPHLYIVTSPLERGNILRITVGQPHFLSSMAEFLLVSDICGGGGVIWGAFSDERSFL